MRQIKTQKELDELVKTRVLKDEEVEIIGAGLKLNDSLTVYGFLKISVSVDMSIYNRRVVARESSRVEAWGSASVHYFSLNVNLVLWGYSCVHIMIEGKGKIIQKQKTTTLIEVPKFVGSWKAYQANYPVVEKGENVLMYKAVHKASDNTYFSDYDKNFKYEVSKIYEHENAPKSANSCAIGLHISHKSWAVSFGFNWNDMALLECEVNPKDIVVSDDCDGKVRTSKLTVVREVPKEEWFN